MTYFLPDRRWMAFFAAVSLAVVELARHHGRDDLGNLVDDIWKQLASTYEEDMRHAHDPNSADRNDQ